MWYTTRQEGFDDPRHTKRGPCINVNNMITMLMRTGFSYELISLTLMYIVYWVYGGSGAFGYDLQGMNEKSRESTSFQIWMVILSGINLLGAYSLMAFQAILADDTCWARGYRAGSKILRLATLMDVVSALFQFIFFLFIAKFYSHKWYNHFIDGGSEWIFFAFTRIIHSFAMLMYADASYLMEVYHDEGAGDLHAYINCTSLMVAGIAEFIVIFFKYSSFSTIFIWLAIAATTVWSFYFEPEVNLVSPALYETELTNDVEIQVEKFAKMSPFLHQDNAPSSNYEMGQMYSQA